MLLILTNNILHSSTYLFPTYPIHSRGTITILCILLYFTIPPYSTNPSHSHCDTYHKDIVAGADHDDGHTLVYQRQWSVLQLTGQDAFTVHVCDFLDFLYEEKMASLKSNLTNLLINKYSTCTYFL